MYISKIYAKRLIIFCHSTRVLGICNNSIFAIRLFSHILITHVQPGTIILLKKRKRKYKLCKINAQDFSSDWTKCITYLKSILDR